MKGSMMIRKFAFVFAMVAALVCQASVWATSATGYTMNGTKLATVALPGGTVTNVNPTNPAITIAALSFDGSGNLYGVHFNAINGSTVYSINTSTGAATALSSTIPATFAPESMSYNWYVGEMQICGYNHATGHLQTEVWSLNLSTGALGTQRVSRADSHTYLISGLPGATSEPSLYAVDASGSTVYSIDTTSGTWTSVGSFSGVSMTGGAQFDSNGQWWGIGTASGVTNVYQISDTNGSLTFEHSTSVSGVVGLAINN